METQPSAKFLTLRFEEAEKYRIDRAADNMDCSTAALVRGMIEYVLNHPEILDRVRPISRVTTRSRDIAEVV